MIYFIQQAIVRKILSSYSYIHRIRHVAYFLYFIVQTMFITVKNWPSAKIRDSHGML